MPSESVRDIALTFFSEFTLYCNDKSTIPKEEIYQRLEYAIKQHYLELVPKDVQLPPWAMTGNKDYYKAVGFNQSNLVMRKAIEENK